EGRVHTEDKWTASAGSAHLDGQFATANFSFPLPAVIPAKGATVTISFSGQPKPGQSSLGLAMSIEGAAVQGETVVIQASTSLAGGTAKASQTVKLFPVTGTIVVGIQDGPLITYTYVAGTATTTTSATSTTTPLVGCPTVHRRTQSAGAINEVRVLSVKP